MKATMVDKLEWVDEYQVGNFMVRQYEAYHKNGLDREEGIVLIMYEGQRIINVKVPLVVPHTLEDRFIVEPSAKGVRSFDGCDGFMIWLRWYHECYSYEAESFLWHLLTNSKLPVSGLSSYIRDKVMEDNNV